MARQVQVNYQGKIHNCAGIGRSEVTQIAGAGPLGPIPAIKVDENNSRADLASEIPRKYRVRLGALNAKKKRGLLGGHWS
jgi:hypothetical protein